MGGTFDPIHLGHMEIAAEAVRRLGLSDVVFVPAGVPWMKAGKELTPGEQRLEMVYLAIAANPSYHVSMVEMDRGGPSFTVDTLQELKRELGEGANLYFILGMDALAELPSWREPHRIIELCHLVAARRPGSADIDVEALERAIPGVSDRIVMLNNRMVDISSSDIRRRVSRGLSIDSMVPEAVAQYIKEKALYIKEV